MMEATIGYWNSSLNKQEVEKVWRIGTPNPLQHAYFPGLFAIRVEPTGTPYWLIIFKEKDETGSEAIAK